MQDFYGDTPFIIDGKTSSHGKKNKTTIREKGVSGAFLAKLVVIFLVVAVVAGFVVFKKFFNVDIPAKTYYAVCFYSGQSKTQAESVCADLVASGGSGYTISGGEYKVYGGVYADKGEAESVAAKQEGAFVENIGWEKMRITFSSPSEAKQAGEAMDYFSEVCDALVRSSLNVDNQEESAAAVYAYVLSAATRLESYADVLRSKELSDFFNKAAYSVGNVAPDEAQNFISTFRYAAQDLIVLRQNLAVG